MHELNYQPKFRGGHKFNLFAGVIMPAISITVEATTHICAEQFFDPIPTVWHLMLVIFVPLAQLQVWFTIRRGASNRVALAGWLNAIALGISIFYSFVYLPLLPLAALTLLLVIGLLPLAPFLSFVAAIVMRFQLSQIASGAPQKSFAVRKAGLLAGLGITAVLIGSIELPVSLTHYGLKMAAAESPETRIRGIRFLRTFGSRDYLLRACRDRTGLSTGPFGYLFAVYDPVTPAEAQKIYYRVTGETFDTSVPPRRAGGRLIPTDELLFDNDQGGEKITGTLKGLSLVSSKLDGSADANGGVAYMQWTLAFQNDFYRQREARAEVQLPPGAVVSRLTLWVNGEEREAAFAGRGKVRQAYEQVVRQRRDPVLVTTAGRNRILVQCFPVPPNGEMKIRLGITVPLLLERRSEARLLLPHFVSRNFRIPDHLGHSVWIESKTMMSTESKKAIASEFRRTSPHNVEHVYVLGTEIKDSELSKPETTINLNRSSQVSQMWSKDPFGSPGFIIRQSIEERTPAHLRRLVLVVDTSAPARDSVWEILAALRSLPPQFDVKLVLADSDGLLESNSAQDLMASGREEIAAKLKSARFAGGADNAPALLKAWELAAEKPGHNVIVWIHSPQLLQLRSVEDLRQRWERRPYGPLLYSVQTRTGSDEIEKQLDGIDEVRSVARMSGLQTDLEILFAQLTGQIKMLEFVRSTKKAESLADSPEATQTSDHLARLWANDEVARILTARDEALNEAATTLAVRYQLVTPISGAVVLETAEQYREAGLKPVDAGTVPTIPEPEMVALLAVVGIFVSWLIYRKYRMTRRGGYPV